MTRRFSALRGCAGLELPSVQGPTPAHLGSSDAAARPPAPAQLRCVLWHSASMELPAELLNSLSKRVQRMTVCTEAYAALAECCLLQRDAQAARVARSAPISGILVLVHPHTLTLPGEVLEALSAYAPGVVHWAYDRSANPKLGPYMAAARSAVPVRPVAASGAPAAAPVPEIVIVPAPKTEHAASASNGHHAAPTPVPASASPLPSASSPAQSGRGSATPVRTPLLLTEEELNMLLDDEPGQNRSVRPVGPATDGQAGGTR